MRNRMTYKANQRRISCEALEPRLLLSANKLTGFGHRFVAPGQLGPHQIQEELVEIDESAGDFVPRIIAGDPNGSPTSNPNTIIDPNVSTSALAGVVALNPVSGASSSVCTGTLISTTHILTAGHCVDFNDNGTPDISLSQTGVRFNHTSSGVVYSGIASVTVHPDYTGFNNPNVNDDLAVIELNNPAPAGVPIYPVSTDPYTSPELIVLGGYGQSGTGTQGVTVGAGFVTKRTGQNIASGFALDDEGSGAREIFALDFDGPNSNTNTLNDGLTLGNNTEVNIAGGDSGGPSFLWNDDGDSIVEQPELTLFGVNTYGQTIGGFVTPRFGSQSGGMVVSSYLDFIDDFIPINSPSVTLTETGGSTDVTEGGATDSYSIALSTNPTGNVFITATSDVETELSLDGNNYSNSVVVTLNSTTADTIFVRAINDTDGEGTHTSTITHQITATNDPVNYPSSLNIADIVATVTDDDLMDSVLVAVDFDEPAGANPTNWTEINAGSNATFSNLIDENGQNSGISLTINESPNGNWDDFTATVNAATIPQHANNLANIDGQIFNDGDTYTLTYMNLNPQVDYELYVFGLEGFFASIQQRVTIQGDGASVQFDQNFNQNDLFINDQVGSSTRSLSEYAQVITADSNGEITITVAPIGGTQDVVLGGIAIAEVMNDPCDDHVQVNVTPLNNGVAVDDNATGTGYIMYSAESVHSRFGDVHPANADHLVGVRQSGGQWQYNNNQNSNSWNNFTPLPTDRLLASADFSADSVTSLQGTNSVIGGINAGYDNGDLVFTPNIWGGAANSGEFGVTGTFFEVDNSSATTTNVTPLNNGVAVDDNATGTGYIMYSAESVHSRFGDVHPANADHLVGVRQSGGQWQYNNNQNSNSWNNFTPLSTDRLLASADFSADSVTSLEGTNSVIGGINAGYDNGDLVFTPNIWGGAANSGEFGVTGTFFEVDNSSATTTNVTPLNNGVAVDDNATGTGYIMYSAESVHSRFGDVHPANADHLVGVRQSGGQWQYNNNQNSNSWNNFTPLSTDRLLASADFSADSVTSLEGTNSVIGGINAGYDNGDLVFTPNIWGGAANSGEFGVTGTFFEVDNSSATTTNVTPLNNGVAVDDNATGTGYIMYSAESVHSRFGDVHPANADHLVGVRQSGGQWQYNNNQNSNSWNNFTPLSTDRLLASADFSADSVTSLEGTNSVIGGINAGYDNGDLVFTPNIWGGAANSGEFGVTGTFFEIGSSCSSPRHPFQEEASVIVSASASRPTPSALQNQDQKLIVAPNLEHQPMEPNYPGREALIDQFFSSSEQEDEEEALGFVCLSCGT